MTPRERRPVVQVDKATREVVAEFESKAAAYTACGARAKMARQLNGAVPVGYGDTYWRYADEFDPDEVFRTDSPRGLPVLLVDLELGRCATFHGFGEAADALNVEVHRMTRATAEGRPFLHGRLMAVPLRGNPVKLKKMVESRLEGARKETT